MAVAAAPRAAQGNKWASLVDGVVAGSICGAIYYLTGSLSAAEIVTVSATLALHKMARYCLLAASFNFMRRPVPLGAALGMGGSGVVAGAGVAALAKAAGVSLLAATALGVGSAISIAAGVGYVWSLFPPSQPPAAAPAVPQRQPPAAVAPGFFLPQPLRGAPGLNARRRRGNGASGGQ